MHSLLWLLTTLPTSGVTGEGVREIRVLMGTMAEIQVSGASEPADLIASAFGRIAETEAALSIWVAGSELSRLNHERDRVVSENTFVAIAHALEIARDSKGAFDPTLAPNGYENVSLHPAAGRVELKRGVTLDLGGIAKGYAVDRALAELEGHATGALVDLGTSSVALFGGDAVTFEVRDPEGGDPPATFRLRRGAVGSSSLDQRDAHIYDPRSRGGPSRARTSATVRAVTVVGESALETDALSTAVFVLGVEEGLALVHARGAEGAVLVASNGKRVVWATRGFRDRYALEVADGVVMRVFSDSGAR